MSELFVSDTFLLPKRTETILRIGSPAARIDGMGFYTFANHGCTNMSDLSYVSHQHFYHIRIT